GTGEVHGTVRAVSCRPEAPTRACVIPADGAAQGWAVGNTPTGVGKTQAAATNSCVRRKHPHGRGEDWRRPSCPPTGLETPPRAWGRLAALVGASQPARNTPTGVGKTT